ncbi:permease [Paenibacillus radicis (ex Gao et al. 2016)]|uniref:Permease n=1 Tax=Paenibacillus radicis (ex Gao et al. 2016) TaxID=1737354 RepID=A0A917H0S6_9BACL|nr:permease [Paenibacillus radicis (ex Gao et al. 2016)]GGG63866.1 permease [Paenibacillus radicis (ex Gao et al. 2016)]
MTKFVLKFGPPLLGVGCLIMLSLLITNQPWSKTLLHDPNLQTFKTLFLSLILETFPFILLGVLFSALLQVFVTDDMIRKFTPRNPVVGILFGALLGLLFPLCECGMIPVVRRLIRKGMPAYIGIVYLVAGPIVNPIVFTSTYSAFRSAPIIAYSRIGLAFVISVIIGLLFYRFMRSNPLKEEHKSVFIHEGADHHGPSETSHSVRYGWGSRLSATLGHAADEFFEMGKYLIFGAMLTAVIQTFINKSVLIAVADQPLFSYLFMMGFAFLLSLCSTSDAFIAASFNGIFGTGPLLAFLVFGPMIDLKNTMMLLSAFKLKIVAALIALTFTLVLAGAWLMEVLL